MFRNKLRKIVKWTALALTTILLVCWIGSNWYHIVCISPDYKYEGEDRRFAVGMNRGSIAAGEAPSSVLSGESVIFVRREPDEPVLWWFAFERFGTASTTSTGSSWVLDIPFWAPVVAAIAVTFAAWKLDRTAALRARTNCCKKCGYHRAGLKPDALCPECGAGVKA